MKRIQIIFGILLIYFAFTNQALAFNHSVRTDLLDEMIQAVNAVVENLREQSRQQEEKLNELEREIARLKTTLAVCSTESQKEGLAEQLKNKTEKMTSVIEAAKKQREEAEGKVVIAKKIETLVTQMVEIVEQNREMEKSFVTLTAISKDRSKAAKLLEAIQNNNRTDAAQVIGGALLSSSLSGVAFSWTGIGAPAGVGFSAAGTAVNVSETQNTNGVKIAFQIGKLRHCLSTKNQCGGKAYSVSK